MKIFEKIYDGESLYDLGRDMEEAIIEEYNPLISDIPFDENGMQKGRFIVSIVWEEE